MNFAALLLSKSVMAIVLGVLLLGGVLTLKLWSSPRRWEKLKSAVVDLDGLATVQVPQEWRYDPETIERTNDSVSFLFRRVNGHHLNGMTSYAEEAMITFAAPDLVRTDFTALLRRGQFDRVSRANEVKTETIGAMELTVYAGQYDRDPVHEPTWQIRLTDHDARMIVSWWGYQKQYSKDEAAANLLYLHTRISRKGNLYAYLQRYRPYDAANWQMTRDRNVVSVNEALRQLGLPPAQTGVWTKHGQLRYIIDRSRPQKFYLVRPVGELPKPDGGFALPKLLTLFKWIGTTWWQDNQGGGGGMIPPDELAPLTAELPSRSEMYLYRIHSFQLWRPLPRPAVDLLRNALAEGAMLQKQFAAGTLVKSEAE